MKILLIMLTMAIRTVLSQELIVYSHGLGRILNIFDTETGDTASIMIKNEGRFFEQIFHNDSLIIIYTGKQSAGVHFERWDKTLEIYKYSYEPLSLKFAGLLPYKEPFGFTQLNDSLLEFNIRIQGTIRQKILYNVNKMEGHEMESRDWNLSFFDSKNLQYIYIDGDGKILQYNLVEGTMMHNGVTAYSGIVDTMDQEKVRGLYPLLLYCTECNASYKCKAEHHKKIYDVRSNAPQLLYEGRGVEDALIVSDSLLVIVNNWIEKDENDAIRQDGGIIFVDGKGGPANGWFRLISSNTNEFAYIQKSGINFESASSKYHLVIRINHRTGEAKTILKIPATFLMLDIFYIRMKPRKVN